MAKLTSKDIRELREFILRGHTVNQLAEVYEVSQSTVRNYTKAERDRTRKLMKGERIA